LHYASYKNISIPEVRTQLTRVSTLVSELEKQLKAIDVGSKGSLEQAGQLLEIELGRTRWRKSTFLLPEYLSLLRKLRCAALAADSRHGPREKGKSKRGRKKGAVENPPFHTFVNTLWMAARQRSGRLTHYRRADGTWAGSWLPALKILKKYLPNFFPRGELGGS
jgi:hypothetical protein